MYQTPATGLVQNPETNEILGVTALTGGTVSSAGVVSGGSTVNVKASKAVILTLGGFENNPQMLRDYLQLQNGGPSGTPGNTGDGIVMVKNVGAALWHMDNMAGCALGIRPIPNQPGFVFEGLKSNYIFVGSDCGRFANELYATRHGKVPSNFYQLSATPNAYTRWIPYPTPFPVYAIFDETVRKAGPVAATPVPGFPILWNSVHPPYAWSSDNSAEIASGWIQQGATIEELAGAINLDPTMLSDSVSQWNAFCQNGADTLFARPKATLDPIATSPFYGVPLAYLLLNTQGGAKRNTKAQVVDDNDNPIPRLYSAGEFGSIYSWAYNGGGNLGESIAWGTFAGQNAAAETAWS